MRSRHGARARACDKAISEWAPYKSKIVVSFRRQSVERCSPNREGHLPGQDTENNTGSSPTRPISLKNNPVKLLNSPIKPKRDKLSRSVVNEADTRTPNDNIISILFN